MSKLNGICGIIILLVFAVGLSGCVSRPARQHAPDDILTNGEAEFSQGKEELVIRHFFDDRREGVFVDVGCYEPFRNSTTAYLEKKLGWSGVAVDAQPGLAARWKADRPRSTFVQYIVTDHSGTWESFYLAMGLSSTNPDHVSHFVPNRKHQPKRITVPTITLTELLDKNGIDHIDLLSMDIEEGEPMALAGFCIEAGPTFPERRAEILKYFSEHNYRRIEKYRKVDIVNTYFTPNEED